MEPCEPVVGKSGGSGQPQLRENWFCRHSREVDARNCGKAEKKKQTQLGLQRQRIEAQDDLDGKGCFSPRRGRGWGRILGGAHNPNINQQNGGVKKEQVKGCGSVNRPTPGSQRPAEPVATGFFGGSNRAEKCGSVKEPWRQAVGRGCRLFSVQSHSARCQDRRYGDFLLSAGQAERLAVQPGTKCGAKPRASLI